MSGVELLNGALCWFDSYHVEGKKICDFLTGDVRVALHADLAFKYVPGELSIVREEIGAES